MEAKPIRSKDSTTNGLPQLRCKSCGRETSFHSYSGFCFYCLSRLNKICSKLKGDNWLYSEIIKGKCYITP